MQGSMLSLLLAVCIAEGARMIVDDSELLLVNFITLRVIGIIDNFQEAQQFLVEPSDQAVNPGEDFVLECIVQNKGGECR